MEMRKNPLVNNQYYHIFSRSIAKFKIFNCQNDYLRFKNILDLYRYIDFDYKYSGFNELEINMQKAIISNLRKSQSVLIEIIAYCIMPTHIHLLLKQKTENGISKYMSKMLNSYTRYFNIKHQRTGPLWEGRFKSVLADTNDQLLHLTRYIHLNPASAGLVKKPENWQDSSYNEYLNPQIKNNDQVCKYDNLFDFGPKQYRKFVNNQKSFQKEISIIKKLLIEDYTG